MAYDQKVDSYGDLLTIEDFIESCESRLFIDYDGFGYPVKGGLADESRVIKPSRRESIPKDATHIIWYNR